MFYVDLGGFPGSSLGKESACSAEDPGSIPGLGSTPGEGIGYLLQYSWVFLVAQMVKNPPAMRETCVWSLGWEDPLEEGMAIHSSTLAWRIPMDRGAWWATVHGVTRSMTEWLSTAHVVFISKELSTRRAKRDRISYFQRGSLWWRG